MKKFIAGLCTFGLMVALYSSNYVMAYQKGDEVRPVRSFDKETAHIDDLEAALDKMYDEEVKKKNEEIKEHVEKARLQKVSKTEIKEEVAEIEKKYKEIKKQRVKEIEEEMGWERLPIEREPEIGTQSKSTDLKLIDEHFSRYSKTGEFKYYAEWDWDNNGWDFLGDTVDLVSVRSLDGVNTTRSYAHTWQYIIWDNGATEEYRSGYDNNGTTEGFGISKRDETYYGVVWNVEDNGYTACQGGMCREVYDTDTVIVSTYFKPKSSSFTTKFFTDFEHNYKTNSLSGSASINFVDLKATSLNVSYNQVNKNYKRTSRGLDFKP
ncbi:hypothetical protein [Brevibacillus borstelensis]|uniref:hypothetical protein n=1 Tax=Brevibacillus borstelensis TaxID=45462 RepID=UPI0030C3A1E9